MSPTGLPRALHKAQNESLLDTVIPEEILEFPITFEDLP